MIKVNEIFGPTIQGEGKSSGREVVFIRLALCNLHCIWCDTPYTWNWVGTDFKHAQKFEKSKESHSMSNDEIIARVLLKSSTVKSIVISGGEPFVQRRQLLELLEMLKKKDYWVEIETNGTIEPEDEFFILADQINCSPKLLNSENSEQLRERPKSLHRLSQSDKVNFKFVVKQYHDIHEINLLVRRYNLKNVYLMPEGRVREELNRNASAVQSMCDEFGYEFADRLHIRLFGSKRAV